MPAGKSMPVTQSACEPFRVFIEKSLHGGLSAQCIFLDLHSAHGFLGSYDSVKRNAVVTVPPVRQDL